MQHGYYGEYDICKFYGESNVNGPAHEMLVLISEAAKTQISLCGLARAFAACIPQKDGNR